MALEERIVKWSKDRPDWQRMVLRRVADGKPLSEDEYDKLVENLVAEVPVKNVDFDLKHVPHTEPEGPQVQLVSIAELQHVNALASETPLTFNAKGLTVVYGDNGSGKSGYARILKSVARARHQENVLTDVFRDTTVESATAKLEVTIGDARKTVSWPVTGMPELRSMLFYDAPSGAYYIDAELDFLYKPPALFVMDGVIQACLAVRSRIDTNLTENMGKKKDLPAAHEACKDSVPAAFLENLSGSSTVKELDELIAKGNPTRIKELKMREAKLTTANTMKERKRLARDAAKLDGVAAHLAEVDKSLGSSAVEALVKQQDEVRALEEAAALLARPFEAEPLPGVGSQPWKGLWEAARKFSEQHAYREVPFPVTGENSRCVLCLQELKPEGKERFSRFEKFVKDDTQAKLSAAQTKWTAGVGAVRRLVCSPEAVEGNLEDLASDDAPLVAEAKALLHSYDEARTAIVEAIRTSAEIPKRDFDAAGCSARLRAKAGTARETSDKLEKPEGIEEELRKAVEERTTLELLEAMKAHRADIVHESQRRKEREVLERVKSSAATTGITKTIAEFSEEHITEVVRDRFTRESDRLKLERITMAKTRAEKGSLLHQTKLVGAKQRVTVPQVFSEGEKSALGLAAFFTEAELDGSKSALIFDDPVSSLDHIRRALVAERVSEIAKARQVIVFTHDAAFVADLKREAQARSVEVSERAVCRSRGGEKKPGRCEMKLPWKIQDVKQRLGILRADLAWLDRESGGWDDDRYEREVASWAGGLSETWERVFSQEIVGQLLADGGTEVRVKKVRLLVKFSQDDFDQFDASYSKVSQWAKRHDKAVTVNYVAPEVGRLEKELELVSAWFERVRKYK